MSPGNGTRNGGSGKYRSVYQYEEAVQRMKTSSSKRTGTPGRM